jgi:hypothetical protein
MKRTYSCPECSAVLNPNVKVILRASKGKRQALLLLSPRPGNYQVLGAEALGIARGDRVSFSCPVCHADLASAANRNLVELRFADEGGATGRVDFSRVFGEHATYVVTREQVRSYGEDAAAYGKVNFFGEGSDR